MNFFSHRIYFFFSSIETVLFLALSFLFLHGKTFNIFSEVKTMKTKSDCVPRASNPAVEFLSGYDRNPTNFGPDPAEIIRAPQDPTGHDSPG
jgi:hypothetical protein